MRRQSDWNPIFAGVLQRYNAFMKRSYSQGMRLIAFCLLFATAAWDYAAGASALQNLPALFCKRLAHHSVPACCPLPAAPAARQSAEKCCETPAPSPDSIPTAKKDGVCNAACCISVVALPPLPRTAENQRELLKPVPYERDVFDLKMDMRT